MAHYPTTATGLQYATYPAGPTAAAQQVTSAAGTNTKGTYVQFAASLGFTANAIEVIITRATATAGRWLIDVATGAAGAETVVLPNALVDMNQTVTTHHGSGLVSLPLAIASGTRVAARTASSMASGSVWLALLLIAAGDTPGCATFVNYGADTSDSGGKSIDPGTTANTKGSYAELTSATATLAQVLVPLFAAGGNVAPTRAIWAVDVATGAAGAESVLVPDLRMSISGNLNDQRLSIRSLTVLTYIAAGTRLAARASCTITDAVDRVLDVAVLIASAPVASVPTVTTLAATAITTTSATLNGTATPNGTSISGFFRWDTVSPPIANTTTPIALGSGSSPVAFSANLSSLAFGTTYYFRAVITDGTTETLGSILSFVTIAPVNHGFKADASPTSPLSILYNSTADALFVFVTWYASAGGLDTTNAVAGITFNGVALTRGGHKAVKGNTMEWWRLASPFVGVATLTVTMASTRLISIGAMNLTGTPSSIAAYTFDAAGEYGERLAPFLRIASAAGNPIVHWLGWNSPSQDVLADIGSTEVWNEEGMATAPGPLYNQLSAGATKTGLAVSTPISWGISVPTEYWGLAALTYTASAAEIQKVTQHVLLVGIDEDHEPIPAADPCTGGGAMPAGTNPAAGPDLALATVPIVWVEVTLVGGTVMRWAKAAIPHGTPKVGRVLSFGTVVRRLTDGDGGPQASTVTTVLADTDRSLRTAAFAGTLHFALVEYLVADLDTIRAGGTPQRVFRGRVQSWTAGQQLTMTLTVQDELSARMTSANAVDATSPLRMIDRTIHDNQPVQSLYGKACPEIYGSVSDADADTPIGSWECRHIQDVTIDPGPLESLGNMPMFLVSAQAVGKIQAVYAADVSEDPATTRARVDPSAFGDWLFVPTQPGWLFPDQYWDTATGRWTVILGRPDHPAIQLAVEGRVPIVVNVCGFEDVGDTTGLTIDNPAIAFLHWFNNRAVEDVGNADWRPIFDFGGYSLFDTTTFDAVAALCDAKGYVVAGVIAADFEFVSWRDRVAEWCRNFGFEVGTNRHGQVIVRMFDPDAVTIGAFTPATILEAGCAVTMRADAVENIVPYVYRRNYLSQLQQANPQTGERGLREPGHEDWLVDQQETVDEDSIDNLGGHPRGERRADVQEYTLVRDQTTADTVAAERLALHAPPNGRAEVSFDVILRDGWAVELGDIVTVDHWDLPWTGARRCHVRGVTLDLDALTLTIAVRDVEDLLTGTVGMDTSARMDIATMDVMRLGYPGDAGFPERTARRRRRR
jgi:hypothetical protein